MICFPTKTTKRTSLNKIVSVDDFFSSKCSNKIDDSILKKNQLYNFCKNSYSSLRSSVYNRVNYYVAGVNFTNSFKYLFIIIIYAMDVLKFMKPIRVNVTC